MTADARDAADLTIDELAQRSGVTARNIRAYQSRGLLPPPEVRGRTGYYGPEHLARLELIAELQGEGFSLELIRRLLETSRGSTAEVLRFTRTLRAPFRDEEPQIVDIDELARDWESTDRGLLQRTLDLGLLRHLGEGRYEAPSPLLLRAGDELRELGVSPEDALDLMTRLRRQTDSVARIFVRLFLDTVWEPFNAADRPEERWPEVAAALERLRPLAADSLLAVFQIAMDDAVERALGHEVERQRRGRRRRRSASSALDGRRPRS
jgi:DNA-binding transcriptional MerR regulator